MIQCTAPDPELGTALRLASYLDCQSRALGENGFQALASNPSTTALLSALVTIFVALIGYRLILGNFPGIGDAIGWAVRLGLVLALVTSWPAFQTLIFRVVTDAPVEVADIVLPAAGLPFDDLDERIQSTYDRLRLGSSGYGAEANTGAGAPSAPTSDNDRAAARTQGRIVIGMPPLPRIASLFVASTSGLTAALRLAVGFLVALGPLASLGLLFEGTTGLFEGWLRTLIGAATGVLASLVAAAAQLVMIESELARADTLQFGGDASAFDPQGIVTVIMIFIPVSVAVVFAGSRAAGAIRLPRATGARSASRDRSLTWKTPPGSIAVRSNPSVVSSASSSRPPRARSAAMAEALTRTAYRDQNRSAGPPVEGTLLAATAPPGHSASAVQPYTPLGAAGRRSVGRRSSTAKRRDLRA